MDEPVELSVSKRCHYCRASKMTVVALHERLQLHIDTETAPVPRMVGPDVVYIILGPAPLSFILLSSTK